MTAPVTYPSLKRALGWAKELLSAPGTPVAPVNWMPIDADGFNWNDKPTWLKDMGLRGSMGNDAYNIIQGVQIGELDLKGPAFGDQFGWMLGNILGDVVETGVTTTPTGTLTSSSAIAATSVFSSVSIPTGTLIQIDVGVNAEIVTTSGPPVGTASPFTIPVPALAKAHASAVAITAINAAPITHAVSLLNGLGPTVSSQPTTHTLTQYYGPTPTSGSRQFSYTCLSDLTITFNAETELLKYAAKAVSLASTPAASLPVPAFTGAPPVASWQAVLGLAGVASGGTQVKSVENGEIAIKRQVKPKFTAQNSQAPYVIQRGGLSCDWKLTFIVVNDETILNYMRNNTQPQLQLIISNGLSGANLLSFQFDLQVAAFTEAKNNFGDEMVKIDAVGSGVFNSTNAGYSAGQSPIKVTLANAIPAGSYV